MDMDTRGLYNFVRTLKGVEEFVSLRFKKRIYGGNSQTYVYHGSKFGLYVNEGRRSNK